MPPTNAPQIVRLDPGQRSVIVIEASTGIVLTSDGKARHLAGSGSFYRVFDSEEQAVAFARAHTELHPAHECSIRNECGDQVARIRSQTSGEI